MIKYNYIKTAAFKKLLILVSLMVMTSPSLLADRDTHTIIISGQVINKEYGNPVEGHAVTIVKLENNISDRDVIELFTDEEGYYSDTISTNLEKGSYKISTLDYKGNVLDTVVHFRFLNYASFNVNIANFSIYMPYHTERLQAKFRYFQKNFDNRFKFTFRDLTVADSIIKWQWDFGDGDSSYLQNPDHLFKNPGVYKVRFTVTIKVNSKIESNSISSLIYISDKSFFHIGGQAFSGYFPIDAGLAYLYLIDEKSNYVPVDTVKFDTLGYYIFYQIPVGNYIVKVQPDDLSQFYSNYLPTYYGNAMFWEDAHIIEFTNTTWDKDIYLLPNEGLKSGEGILEGQVSYSDEAKASFINTPISKVDLYLMSESNNVYLSKYSDETGFFDFSNIPVGDYWIYPELTGIKTEKTLFTLTEDNPTINDIQLIIGPQSPDFIIENNPQQSIINNLFPNPASNIVFLTLKDNSILNFRVELMDLNGKVILQDNIADSNNNYSINTNELKSGLYIIKVYDGKLFDSKILVIK
ncbi:MAG: hypothetical protein C0595_01205 [Marinilabiliales bacterium]|mgnify:CR=1 FL=1|nr:MAG: hypothetical protein C0595_01205 [Marinilabiliales bacterium]